MRLRRVSALSLLSLALAACVSNSEQSSPESSTDSGVKSGLDASVASSSGNDAGMSTTDMDATLTETGDSSVDETNDAGAAATDASASDGAAASRQVMITTIGANVIATTTSMNQGTAIGGGSSTGATPSTLANVAMDSSNKQTVSASNPFTATGTVPDTAAGFCTYTNGTGERVSYVTGSRFEVDGGAADPMVSMAPFYFPLVYNSTLTPTANAFGPAAPLIGLFDWRPKDLDEALVVAESDDNGKTWYFMQTVFELFPDLTNPISGGHSATATATGCPASLQGTNAKAVSANASAADDGWGHAAIVQLPGAGNAQTAQFLYLLDRNANDMPGTSTPVVDNAPLHVLNLAHASPKFPIWNTNNSTVGANDVKSIQTALTNTSDAGEPVVMQDSVGLLNPDGIMAVFPTSPTAAAGSAVDVLYVQKIVGGDNTGSTALPMNEQCGVAPFSGDSNHDISNVRMASTKDGVNFTDLGIVQGLNDPTTTSFGGTRWISPRGTLVDIHGDGSVWGLYFAGGNCLDGDSDAFHYIGYAESTDRMHWTVFNDVNHPIASINTITTTDPSTGKMVTVPSTPAIVPTESWFAERLYAPSAVQIDATHLSMTFAGYGVQNPKADLLDYRQIGNVVVTVSVSLPAGTPNNINAH